jgi:pyruvate formate lyase activating enzyme
MPSWLDTSRRADHWKAADESGRVECTLCPRHCKPRSGQFGFCRVRGNVDGALQTFNYGKSVAATEEVIETEAVYHFSPGRRILSLGNIGCMMACDFCQNWSTSQVRHLDPAVVKFYSPEQILEICREHDIRMISWTYNDPVVWHEFVRDTSRLAQKQGIRTLYKSAFYIEEEPARELVECIDIFSLSLKSMNEAFHRQVTKAELGPMLERAKLVHRSGRHVEISQLVVPQFNDRMDDVAKTARWVLDHLGEEVPLHFVAFHPAYKYVHVGRTPLETLLEAREVARREGIRHCYLGNVYREGLSDTRCGSCGHLQVARFGLTSTVVGIRPDGACAGCGRAAPIRFPFEGLSPARAESDETLPARRERLYRWTPEVRSVHLVAAEAAPSAEVTVRHQGIRQIDRIRLGGGLERAIVSRAGEEDREIHVSWNHDGEIRILPVLDRAHFPVTDQVADAVYRPLAASTPAAESL